MSGGLDCEESDPFGQFSQTDEREAIMGRVPGGVSNGFQAVAQNIESYVLPEHKMCTLTSICLLLAHRASCPVILPDVCIGRAGSLRLAR